jgi:hypothetical protein
VILGGVASLVLVASTPARASHQGTAPPSPGCVQAIETPLNGGVYFDGQPRAATVGVRCQYTSIAVGGYRALPRDDWRVIVDRADGRRVAYSSALGSPTCAEGVIQPGDVVTVASSGAVAAGEGIRC